MLHIRGKKINGGPAIISSIICIALKALICPFCSAGETLQELSKMDLPDNDAVKSLMLRALLSLLTEIL